MRLPSPMAVNGRAGDRPAANLLAALDPRAKIVGFIGFALVVVTTPPRPAWPFVVYALVLTFLAALGRVSPVLLAKRASVVVPFVVMVAVFLPFLHPAGETAFVLGRLRVTQEGLLVVWNVGAKALLGAMSMILLTSLTTFPELIEGAARLRTPKVIVLMMTFMHRYGSVFAEESRRMQRAMASRNFRARWLANVPVLGHMLGSLFLRSYGRGERVYVAMVSRGFDGTLPQAGRMRLGSADAVFAAALLLIASAVRLTPRLWGAG